MLTPDANARRQHKMSTQDGNPIYPHSPPVGRAICEAVHLAVGPVPAVPSVPARASQGQPGGSYDSSSSAGPSATGRPNGSGRDASPPSCTSCVRSRLSLHGKRHQSVWGTIGRLFIHDRAQSHGPTPLFLPDHSRGAQESWQAEALIQILYDMSRQPGVQRRGMLHSPTNRVFSNSSTSIKNLSAVRRLNEAKHTFSISLKMSPPG